ncbi:MAG: hypothetical protein HYS60_01765 [Candidatus Wildermuthbacteria bacterium]|nr:hypothetical protein [Candidatus Wildermuthbacteria bacterium]
MEILPTIGKVLLVLLAVASVVLPLVSERRNYQFVWSVWRRFRIKMFFECLGIVTLTIATAIALWQVPGLNYGWINLFFGKGGNILVRPIMEGSESTNVLIRFMVPLFFIALAFVLPFLAREEERIFRKGHDDWGSITKQSVKFGLAHCLVGVPLAAGIALIIAGLFYGFKYKSALDHNADTMGYWRAEDEAVMVSTTYHTMHNMIVVGLLLFVAIVAI